MDTLALESENKHRPDLYIALVGAAGTDVHPVKTQLKAHLASFDYSYNEVKVSSLISEFCEIDTSGMEEDVRVRALMDGGDHVRANLKRGDGVISLVVNYIQSQRENKEESTTGLLGSTAFIIDSLKNPEEIKTLNGIYGRNFYTISVYATADERENKLANRIAETCNTNTRENHKERAKKVIKEDERRDTTPLSQDVQGTFPKSDFFVKCGKGIEIQIKRFVDLIFGDPFITPTLDEYAMFVAKASSLRSNDLSRQVGAAIFGKDNIQISSGYNEVPYPSGGAWYEGRAGSDNRDHMVEYDPNSAEISNIFRELVNAFRKAELLSNDATEQDDDTLVEGLLHGQWRALTVDARVRNLIEFGRVVHAEMHAIAEAARIGRAVNDAVLFCTTFPCHICARHIIAAGIGEVVFIEPYPKSLTKKLYEREISTDEQKGRLSKSVVFRPFQGVSPVLYQRVFAYRMRKHSSGAVVRFNRSKAVPTGAVYGVSNRLLEQSVSAWIDDFTASVNVGS